MTLGDLEFKAEDFQKLYDEAGNFLADCPQAAAFANCILREKLAKASGIRRMVIKLSETETGPSDDLWIMDGEPEARLVCIEKVGKKESPEDGIARCGICGEQMPDGEEMFNYHGHSGPCPTKVGK